MNRFEKAVIALTAAMRNAEKEATRLEITSPQFASEARIKADGLADALTIINSLSDLSVILYRMESK